MGRKRKEPEYKFRTGPDGEPILPGFFDDSCGYGIGNGGITVIGKFPLTFAETLVKAQAVKPQINTFCEFEGAYAFDYNGSGPVVILKDSGEAFNFAEYATKHGNELIHGWEPLPQTVK